MQAKPNIVDGVLAGGVVALALALAALPFVGRSFGEMYREFGGEMPLLATSYWFPLGGLLKRFAAAVRFLAARGAGPLSEQRPHPLPLFDRLQEVLGLERLLEVKRKLSRPKDKLMALQIEATLEERNKPN